MAQEKSPGYYLLVGGWKETSLVDVLESVSFTLWLSYCNFKCPWCSNSELARGHQKQRMPIEKIVSQVIEAKDFVDYFHVTGGEPTLQYKALTNLFIQVKEKAGLKLSLDTNASLPEALQYIFSRVKIQHVAVDVKAPLSNPALHAKVTGLHPKIAEKLIPNIREGIILSSKNTEFLELRTPLVPDLLTPSDLETIAKELASLDLQAPRMAYVVQQFIPYEGVPDEYRNKKKTPRDMVKKTAEKAAEILSCNVEIWYRTLEDGAVRIR
jgi:pyruvate formate lyase activating enzyme